MNSVNLVARTVRDVELRYTQSGVAFASVTVAVDRGLSKAKKEEAKAQNKPTSDFIKIVAFGSTAEYIGNYLKKGKLVAINGRIQTGSYDDKDGKKVYTTEINCQSVEILEYENKQEQAPEGFNNISDNGNLIPF